FLDQCLALVRTHRIEGPIEDDREPIAPTIRIRNTRLQLLLKELEVEQAPDGASCITRVPGQDVEHCRIPGSILVRLEAMGRIPAFGAGKALRCPPDPGVALRHGEGTRTDLAISQRDGICRYRREGHWQQGAWSAPFRSACGGEFAEDVASPGRR